MALLAAALALVASPLSAAAGGSATAPTSTAAARIAAAYPEHIARIEDGKVHWRDGAVTAFDDGQGDKPFEAWLDSPDVEDMLRLTYPRGPAAKPPPAGSDPGRARNHEFFVKIYGDCSKGGVARHLVDVVWLPAKYGKKIKVTRVNGVARRVAAISRELDALPKKFDRHLQPPAGTYNCRAVAGTGRASAHGYGIAIDIATATSDYWRWSRPGPGRTPAWRNRIPHEIVAIFEAHGFIWGGKWHHYDTMHFEYRPELLPPSRPLE